MGVGAPSGFSPADLPNLKLWTKYNSGITVTGSGVSQWDDVSGNDNHLKQGVDANRPSKEGDGSILFNGIDHSLKADTFTLSQPETIYLLFKQVTWTSQLRIFDGNASNTGLIFQNGTTPDLDAFAGANSGATNDLALDTYGIATVVFNGASSIFYIDNNTPITGNFGTSSMNGFTLGASGSNGFKSNIQVKEAFIYSDAHDAAIRLQLLNYLASVGGLSI